MKVSVRLKTTYIDNVNQQKGYSDLWNDKNNDNGNKKHLYRFCKEFFKAEGYLVQSMPHVWWSSSWMASAYA